MTWTRVAATAALAASVSSGATYYSTREAAPATSRAAGASAVVPDRGQYADVIGWLDREIYPGVVGHALDHEGIAAWAGERYTAWRQRVGHEDAKHRVYDEIAAQIHPPDVPTVARPIRGQLRVAGRCFADDGGCLLPVGAHAGDFFLAYTQPDRRALALEGLDQIARAGYQWVRVWTRLRGDWWRRNAGEVGQELTPGYWGLWRDFVGEVESRGLKIHAVAGDLAFLSTTERRRYFEGLRDAVAERPTTYVLVEWANEARDTAGGLGPDVAAADMRTVRERFDGLTALSAYTGHESRELFLAWTPGYQPFVYVHGLRSGVISDKLRHIFSLGYEGPLRWLHWQGEPWGVGPRVSVMENAHEIDAEAMAAGAAIALIARQAWTYFSSDGVITDGGFDQQAGFAEVPRMAAYLAGVAPDLQTWPILVHGGRPEAVLTFGARDAHDRIDQAVGPAGVVAVVHSTAAEAAKSVTVEATRPMRVRVVHPATQAVEADTRLGKGQRLEVRFARARVVVGTFE